MHRDITDVTIMVKYNNGNNKQQGTGLAYLRCRYVTQEQ